MRFFNTPTHTMANTGLFILRLALFTVFIVHGSQKVLGLFGGHGLQTTLQFFTAQQHIPTILAIIAIFTEFLAPLALLFGLLTRLAALGLMCNIVVAAITVHLHNGFFMNWSGQQKGEGIEFFILAGGITLALIVMGAGEWSLDTLLAKRPRYGKNLSANIADVSQKG